MRAAGAAENPLGGIEYRDRPAIVAVADSLAGRQRVARAAAVAGCRISEFLNPRAAARKLGCKIAIQAVLADFEHDSGAALDSLLGELERAAETGRYPSVISTSLELTGIVFGATPHQGIEHLCKPNEVDWAAAVAIASAFPAARLHDINRGEPPARLQQLREEVGRIATALAALSEEKAELAAQDEPAEASPGSEIDAGQIRAIIRARRLRDHYFNAALFADPAWDMLLDLMAARLEREKVAVSSLCIAAAVPPTTALRWIKTLSDQGLFVRVADPQDGRRVFIELSAKAAGGVAAYLKAAQRISPTIL